MTVQDKDAPSEIILLAKEIGFTADEIADLNRIYAKVLSNEEKIGNRGAPGRNVKASPDLTFQLLEALSGDGVPDGSQ